MDALSGASQVLLQDREMPMMKIGGVAIPWGQGVWGSFRPESACGGWRTLLCSVWAKVRSQEHKLGPQLARKRKECHRRALDLSKGLSHTRKCRELRYSIGGREEGQRREGRGDGEGEWVEGGRREGGERERWVWGRRRESET